MRARAAAACLVLAGMISGVATACDLVLGLDDPTPGGGGAGGGGGGGTGASGKICEPGTKQTCKYTGGPTTENVGTCRAAEQTCDADGTSWGACEGEVLPAAEVCHNQEDEDCDGAACAALLWSKLWGDAGDQTVTDIGTDGGGSTLLLGAFEGSIEFDVAHISVAQMPFLAKLDPLGGALWSRTGDPAVSQVMAVRDDGVIGLMGAAAGKLSVAALDSSGVDQWTRVFPGAIAVSVTDATFHPSGDIAVMGSFVSSLQLDGTGLVGMGSNDVFVATFASNDGSTLDANSYGTMAIENGGHIASTMGGYFAISSDYEGMIFGCPGTVGLQMIAPKLCIGGTVYDHALASDDTGALIVAGRAAGLGVTFEEKPDVPGAADLFVVKLSAAGDIGWSKSFGGPGFEPAGEAAEARVAMAVNSKRELLISVHARGTINFGGGPLGRSGDFSDFLVKLDKDGKHVWSRSFGPVGERGGCLVAAGTNDEPVLACSVEAPAIDFGAGPLLGKGGLDVVVARFAP